MSRESREPSDDAIARRRAGESADTGSEPERGDAAGPPTLGPLAFTPAPYYCEENVWQLCAQPGPEVTPRAAVFISNVWRQVAVAHQRAARRPDLPVVWDYHVVMAGRCTAGWFIWDPDSTLGSPVPLRRYLQASVGYPHGLPPPYTARFRVIEASAYRRILATDRSHMRDDSGHLRAPAPSWPPIGQGTNLMRLVDLEDDWLGEVVELSQLPSALARLEDRG